MDRGIGWFLLASILVLAGLGTVILKPKGGAAVKPPSARVKPDFIAQLGGKVVSDRLFDAGPPPLRVCTLRFKHDRKVVQAAMQRELVAKGWQERCQIAAIGIPEPVPEGWYPQRTWTYQLGGDSFSMYDNPGPKTNSVEVTFMYSDH